MEDERNQPDTMHTTLCPLGMPPRILRALVRKALEPVGPHDQITHVSIESHRAALALRVPLVGDVSESASDVMTRICSTLKIAPTSSVVTLASIHLYALGSVTRVRGDKIVDFAACVGVGADDGCAALVVDVWDEIAMSVVPCHVGAASLCLPSEHCDRPCIIMRLIADKSSELVPTPGVAPSGARPGARPAVAATHRARPVQKKKVAAAVVAVQQPIDEPLPVDTENRRRTVAEDLLGGATCMSDISDIHALYVVLKEGVDAHIDDCRVKAFMILERAPPPICRLCATSYAGHAGTCKQDSRELAVFLNEKDITAFAPAELRTAVASAAYELRAWREWKERALFALKDLELSSLAQRERSFLVSHNIAVDELDAPSRIFDLTRNEAGEVDEEAQLTANIEACRKNMEWFADSSPTRSRFRFKLTIAPSATTTDRFRVITARAAPPWTGLIKALTNNWDDLANRPTRSLLSETVAREMESRKRKRSTKKSKKAVTSV
jgi:hypothetical protein